MLSNKRGGVALIADKISDIIVSIVGGIRVMVTAEDNPDATWSGVNKGETLGREEGS